MRAFSAAADSSIDDQTFFDLPPFRVRKRHAVVVQNARVGRDFGTDALQAEEVHSVFVFAAAGDGSGKYAEHHGKNRGRVSATGHPLVLHSRSPVVAADQEIIAWCRCFVRDRLFSLICFTSVPASFVRGISEERRNQDKNDDPQVRQKRQRV